MACLESHGKEMKTCRGSWCHELRSWKVVKGEYSADKDYLSQLVLKT